MNRVWWATIHEVAELDMTQQLHNNISVSELLFLCQILLFIVENIFFSRAMVLSLWDLMPDNPRRWSWYNNRNKVHNKRNVRESSQNDHLPPI